MLYKIGAQDDNRNSLSISKQASSTSLQPPEIEDSAYIRCLLYPNTFLPPSFFLLVDRRAIGVINEYCISTCKKFNANARYTGTFDYRCYCAFQTVRIDKHFILEECNVLCLGNSEKCGGLVDGRFHYCKCTRRLLCRDLQILKFQVGSTFASRANSPDSKLLASASDDRAVRLWDAGSGAALQTHKGRSGWLYAVAFSPDGKLLASASADRTVKLWNAGSGAALQTLELDASIETLYFLMMGHLSRLIGGCYIAYFFLMAQLFLYRISRTIYLSRSNGLV